MSRLLNIETPRALSAYLRAQGLLNPGEEVEQKVLTGGVSNRTVLLKRENGESWVVKQALEKLRVKVDWYSSPERIHREAAGLRHLQSLAPEHLPRFIAEDFEQHLLIMEAVAEPHDNWKTLLLAGQLKEDHLRQFGRLLGTIHRKAFEHAELKSAFADRSFFESLRLEPYYLFAAEQVSEARAFLHELVSETRTQTLTLVHGDYSPKNILVFQDKLILLDHEVIHWGDPAFDLGFGLTHLLSKAHHLSGYRNDFLAAAAHFWNSYQEALSVLPWSAALEPRAVRHTLACMLARVAGRSPLEYLGTFEQKIQRQGVILLMRKNLTTLKALVQEWSDYLNHVYH